MSINLETYKGIKYNTAIDPTPKYAKGFYTQKNNIIIVGELKKQGDKYIDVSSIRLKFRKDFIITIEFIE